MLKALHFVGVTMNIPPNMAKLPHPAYRHSFQICLQKSIVCAAKWRNRYAIGKSGRLVIESACMLASRLRLLPEPVEVLLREFGSGNGNRGGNGFWNGFGGGGFGAGNRRRMKLGMLGLLLICCAVGFWLGIGKELGLEADAFLGGLGLILFGLSVEVCKRGAREWVLGFCCCAFVVLVLNRDKFQSWVGSLARVKKNGRRKMRVF